jgi:hypothetical protein
MCFYYLGVNFNHDDLSGDGKCLGYLDSAGTAQPCRKAIEEGHCPKKRTTPKESE